MTKNEFYYNLIKNFEVCTPSLLRDILIHFKIINPLQECPECIKPMSFNLDNSKSAGMRYRCASCRRKFEFRRFTVFTDYRMRFEKILLIIVLFIEEKTLKEISDCTNLSLSSVQKLFNFIREKIKCHINENEPTLDRDRIVEIDETLLAKGNIIEAG